jgi:hypothetical protein
MTHRQAFLVCLACCLDADGAWRVIGYFIR